MGKYSCPTVEVDDGKGSFFVVNESDFDDKEHKLYGAQKKKEEKESKKVASKDSPKGK